MKYIDEHFELPDKAVLIDKELKSYISYNEMEAIVNIKLRMVTRIIEMIRRQKQISKRNVRIMIIDDNSNNGIRLVKEISSIYNHIYLVSDRLEQWGKIIDSVFKNQGLVIYQYNKPVEEDWFGDIVINLDYNGYDNLLKLKNVVVFDIGENISEQRRICNLNPHIEMYRRVCFTNINQPVDFELVSIILEDKLQYENGSLDELFATYSIEFEGVS